MERILVTGSSGHLGSMLRQSLEQQGHEVIPGDRYGTVPKDVKTVINCGTYGNIYDHKNIPEIYRANVMNVATIASSKPELFINISSSSVLLPEQTHYSTAKRTGEKIVEMSGGVSIRPSTIVGYRDNPAHLVPKLIKSCLTGEQMPFVPEPHHDFIDVSDVVHAIALIMTCLIHNPELVRGKTFNVSRNESHSNQQVKEIIEEATQQKANIRLVENMRPYDTKDWKVDNSDIVSLGWKPKVSLDQSIRNIVNQLQYA